MKKVFTLLFVCTCLLLFFGFNSAPHNFPSKKIIKIEVDSSNQHIAEQLKQEHVIRSVIFFKLFNFNRPVKAGSYYFNEKESALTIISRLRGGKTNIPYVRVTIPEGSNNEQIAAIIWGKLEKFDAPQFIRKAQKYQGYLFPDTYNIPIIFDEDLVIQLLKNTFERKVGKVEANIVNMAAILEEEGNAKDNRKMIADILWRRLRINMPLQVDVYMDTYKKRGLPPMPITNPGLESINAAKEPTPNPYLYYISDKDGIFHYAKTYDEHLVNIQKYLKK